MIGPDWPTENKKTSKIVKIDTNKIDWRSINELVKGVSKLIKDEKMKIENETPQVGRKQDKKI